MSQFIMTFDLAEYALDLRGPTSSPQIHSLRRLRRYESTRSVVWFDHAKEDSCILAHDIAV
jgi:hypothetical protein